MRRPLRPIFEPGRVTPQPVQWGFACYQFALLGFIEATVDSDDEKNRLCPPIHYWEKNEDFPSAFLAMMKGNRMRAAQPSLSRWMNSTRLNPLCGLTAHADNPTVTASRDASNAMRLPRLRTSRSSSRPRCWLAR
jgi:hypothetical protein